MALSLNNVSRILLFFLVSLNSFAQEAGSYFDLNYFKGNVLEHNDDILHLITGHPEGVIAGYNLKTDGSAEWHRRYNFPEYGVSMSYQDLKNPFLGNNIALYGHFNFFFFKRQLMFRIGQGLAYTSDPYDRETNFRNNAFGSTLMSSTYMMLNYHRDNILPGFGVRGGMSLIHYSNANVKAPNASLNSVVFNLGMTYALTTGPLVNTDPVDNTFTEPIRFNLVFRGGINESDTVGSGQFPFYIGSFYADKRINAKSALQLGTEVFFSEFLAEYTRYRAVAYPDEGRTGVEDYRRVGVFAGHELFVNRLSLLTQVGYYAYYPIDFEGRVYLRIGLKHYFGDHFFGVVSLKSHGAKAEAVEWGIGYRI